MKINNIHYHTIWLKADNPTTVQVIDQRKLPFKFEITDLRTSEDVYWAIKEMVVRGAPLIGITAAYGMYLALLEYKKGDLIRFLNEKAEKIKSARPTAVNLEYTTDLMLDFMLGLQNADDPAAKTLEKVHQLKQQELTFSEEIGKHGFQLIKDIFNKTGKTVQILTHCNAGWLACIDWGTATAPIYQAHRKGIPVHVWVDETRPRNQGARLTAFELAEEGVPHTVITDNTGGHLMQHAMVDMVIVGSDRTTVTGDVANKIGTYLKALAAKDNNIPFYVALPSSTIDWKMTDGIREIPVEQRSGEEVSKIEGWYKNQIIRIRLTPEQSQIVNFGFDITPARLVTGLITERGICQASEKAITAMFPEKTEH